MKGRLADLARRYLPSGAIIVSALFFGSYVVGLLRERVLASTFGAGAELDAYNAAFQLPELLFDVLVEAGLAAAFIPVFARLRSTEDGIADADRFARTVLTLSIVIMGVGSVLLFIFAEGTTEIIAPGFTGRAASALPRPVPDHARNAGPLRGLADARPGAARRSALLLVRPGADPLQHRDHRRDARAQ